MGARVLRGWDRVGVQQIFGPVYPVYYCSTLSSVDGLPCLLLIQGVIGWLEVGSPDRDPGS